ncbi:LemA family protein [Luteimonas terrae]|nr:LemA family protein [Luteimonas terrae]
MMATLIGGLLLAALLVWAVIVFNRLMRLRNQVRTAWADIDVQLVRRHDLVPQLVSAVQAYAAHERATLDAVTALRARAMATADAATLSDLEQSLGAGIQRLIALQEAYPVLAASDNFAQLQADLVEVETQLQYARRFYNGAVRDLNDAVQRVPDTLVARLTGVGQAVYFQAVDDSRRPAAVELTR